MATRGRQPGQGKVPGSGRKKGSLDRTSRLLISERLAFDILQTYEKLGADWLFKVATERPDLFINQCLSKLLPPAFKEDPDAVNNTQNNYVALIPLEAARRVAFALASGAHAQAEQEQALIEAEREPEFSPRMWRPPTDAPDMPEPDLLPEPVDALDPARERWVSELPLTPEQRADNALTRETRESNISTYRGSAAEQPYASVPRPAPLEISPGERRRAVMSRRNELL